MRHATILITLFVLAFVAPPAHADGPDEKEPGPKATGKVYEWKSKDGLAYQYRVPKDYDPDAGAGLTVILHGSNLDRRWGFANHGEKTFRPDDIVVSPDGMTSNGRGGFNALGEKKDAKRLKALLDELCERFKINGVYLYGHSQGSFFAFYFAGEYPEDVHGIVGHASGVWNWTTQGKKGHHQAIVLMHGTQDPVVPYGQSEGGLTSFLDAKYPTVRLRSLEGWNHWPSEHNGGPYGTIPHTSQQLAWVEGMTTADPKRLAWCFEFLADNAIRERHDYAGTYTLAKHVEASAVAPEKLKQRAKAVAAAVEALAAEHAKALEAELPEKLELEAKAWPGHLPMFLRGFTGVPACDAFAERHDKLISKNREAGLKHFRAYWKDAADRPEKAFAAGLDALEAGFLYHQAANHEFRTQMQTWRKDLKLGKKDQKRFDAVMKDFEKAQELGWKAFDKLNKKDGKLP